MYFSFIAQKHITFVPFLVCKVSCYMKLWEHWWGLDVSCLTTRHEQWRYACDPYLNPLASASFLRLGLDSDLNGCIIEPPCLRKFGPST